MKLIEGAGGIGAGGGGNQKPPKPRPPVITQDDPGLRTISFAKMQFLLCEGPILGPAVGLEESVFLDETPIRTANGVSPQPEDLVISFGRSTWEQTAVPGYGSVSNVIGVDKTVKEGLPVTQQVIATDPTVAYAARVLLTWQGLVRTIISGEKAGDVLPHDCPYGITYTDAHGAQRGPGTIQLFDKFSGPFQREAEFALEGPGPWTIKVERFQQDDDKREAGTNNTEQYQSTFSFSSVVLTTWVGLRYPNSAILTLGMRADQYSELPAVAVDLHGIIMRVPSNYDPGTRTYGGLWDGGFKWAYTNNPAWVMYDLFLNDRYGLGQYIDPLLTDKWTLYEIARYCDQMVPDGKGGWEPRFTCNIILQTAEDAWTVLQQFSSIFRGAIYYASSSIVTVQDRKKDCVYTFNEANTIEQFDDSGEVSQGNFSYAGSAKRARHTAVLVSWDDPADSYQPRVEYVADQAGMLKLGYRPLQLRLMGVTSRGQALRAANWALLTESLLDDTISFATGMLGAALRPGDLIKIADPNKAAIRMGGRVVGLAADDVVTVDEAPKNPPGGWGGATFSFMAPDTDGQPVLRTGAVLPPVADAPNDLKVVWSTGDRPLPGWPFLIEVPGRTAQQFRVLTISEQSGDDGITYGITALRYRGDIYDAVDFGSPLGDDGNAIWKPGRIDPPIWTVAQVVWDGGQAKLDLAWQPATSDINLGDFNLTVSSYRLQYLEGQKQDDGSITWSRNWIEASRASANTDRIIVSGYTGATVYKVRVAAISRVGLQSTWAERQALTLEEWMPMPDLSVDGKLTHVNLPTGGHAFSLAIANTTVPPYVRGKLVEVQEGGPGDAWIVATSSNLQAVDEWTFGAIRAGLAAGASKAVRVSLTTFVPGLAGSSYAIDHVDRLEIVPPSPEGLRVVLEGGRQSYAGQRRFSWKAGKTPFPQNWPSGAATDVVSYDIRFIQGLSPNWEQALPLLSDGITGDQTWFETNLFDAGQWVVMIRAKDRTGWLSDAFAAVAIGIGDPIPTNAVETLYLQTLGWAGTLVNLERVGTELVQIDPSLPGEYIFPFYNNYTDAQLVITTNAIGTYRWEVEEGGRDTDLFYLPPLGDPLYYFGGDPMYPTPGAAAINGYHPYAPNELVKEGYYNYKLTIISLDGTTPASVQDVTMVFDYPDVTICIEDVAVDPAGTQVDFPTGTFRKLKAVSLTVQDDPTTPGAAINAIILLKDKDYVEIVPLDSAGNRVAALVDIFAVGY